MRVGFWRKKKRGKLDAIAGGTAERPAIWPLTRPLPWKPIVRGVLIWVLVITTMQLYDAYRSSRAREQFSKLIVVEAAPLDEVCRDDTHFLTLRSVAPCDPAALASLPLVSGQRSYVAFAGYDNSYSSVTPAYLLDGACYEALHDQRISAQKCVLATLRQ